jgi:hypothetical protein
MVRAKGLEVPKAPVPLRVAVRRTASPMPFTVTLPVQAPLLKAEVAAGVMVRALPLTLALRAALLGGVFANQAR